MSVKKLSRYEILEEIGRGNMGAVFRARDPSMDRTVAVKIVHLGFALDDAKREVFLGRFQREAQIAGRLTHPNIVAVHDVGLEEDEPFLVMEYFPGTNLSRLLETGPLPPEEARLVLVQLARALAYAHGQGVVHRDIKPANVLYRPGPLIKLVDFGIARLESSELTATGEFIGTPSYMSPEIFAGRPVDARSDLFSAGVVLYQLLTGVRPFEGESVSRTIYRVLHEAPPAPSTLCPGLDRGWDVVCNRLLAKEPEARYRDASALLDDLDALGRGSLDFALDEPTAPVVAPPPPRRRGLGRWALLAALPLALLVALWLARPGSPPSARGTSDEPATARGTSDEPATAAGSTSSPALTAAGSTSSPALVSAAERALEDGRLDEAEVSLRALGAFAPEHPKLTELGAALERARFAERLPLVFVARHEHRIGFCTGDLKLEAAGIVFVTSRHGTWRFAGGAVKELDRPSATSLDLTAASPENGELERFRFTYLRPSLAAEDFRAYVETVVR